METRVLIIQTAFLGDLILTLPLINTVLENWNEGEVVLLVRKGFSVLFKRYPHRLIVVEDSKKLFFWRESFFHTIREKSPAAALVPHRSHRSALIARFSGAKFRAGFSAGGLSLLFTHTLPYEEKVHEVNRNLSLAKHLVNNVDESKPWLKYQPFTEDAMKERWRGVLDDEYITVFPFTNWKTKNWGDSRWIKFLSSPELKKYRVILCATGDKKERADHIALKSKNPGLINLAGMTSLEDLLFLVKHSKAVVSGDSSPVHIASAYNVPVLVIYGPTSPARGFGPLSDATLILKSDLSCSPCSPHGPRRCPLGHHRCMDEITPEQVISSLNSLLHSRS